MAFSKDQGKYIIKAYQVDKKSLPVIAKELETYVNKIRRFLIKNGVKIRSFAESQTLALKTGRSEHPTEGRNRTREEKNKISDGVAKSWDNMPENKKEKIREQAKEKWEAMTDKEREKMSTAAKQGMRKAAVDGSKMEKFIQESLEELDIPVIFHKKDLVENKNLEVDIFLPSYNTAIEIDGPTHFLPIFGKERLEKTMASDREKIGLLLANDFNILRIKHISKNASRSKAKKIVDQIVKFLESLGKKPKYLEVES